MRKRRQSNKGFTLIELLITVSILGVVLSIGALNLKPLNDDAQNAASQLGGFFKQTRAKAMSTTSAYRVDRETNSQTGQIRVYAERARRCNDTTWVRDDRLQTELPKGVELGIVKWNGQPCFNSRGFVSNAITVKLTDDRERVREVELLLGGAVDVK